MTGHLRLVTSLIVALIFLGSCREEPSSLGIVFPVNLDVAWEYDVQEEQNGRLTSIGSVRVENFAREDVGRQRNVLRQRRFIRPASIAGLGDEEELIRSAFFRPDGDQLLLLTESFGELFDLMLISDSLEVIAADTADGQDFQRFRDFNPDWVPIAEFTDEAANDVEVHPAVQVFIAYTNRGNLFTGSVSVRTTTRFADFEQIPTAIDEEDLLTFRFRNRTFLDFDLQRNGEPFEVPRQTIDLFTWIHPQFGILRRERSEVSIIIDSQFPAAFIPRQVWEITALEGFEEDEPEPTDGEGDGESAGES